VESPKLEHRDEDEDVYEDEDEDEYEEEDEYDGNPGRFCVRATVGGVYDGYNAAEGMSMGIAEKPNDVFSSRDGVFASYERFSNNASDP
jgi:hypothetical protein